MTIFFKFFTGIDLILTAEGVCDDPLVCIHPSKESNKIHRTVISFETFRIERCCESRALYKAAWE